MRRTIAIAAVSLCLAAMPMAGPAAAEDCDTANASQADLTACYAKAYKAADAELNALFKEIEARLKGNADATRLLITAQKAWIGFRNAECAFSSSGVAQGSAYPMVQAICLQGLTEKRVADFKAYLKCQEGDLDCPVPAP